MLALKAMLEQGLHSSGPALLNTSSCGTVKSSLAVRRYFSPSDLGAVCSAYAHARYCGQYAA